jgi:hypothetical protein
MKIRYDAGINTRIKKGYTKTDRRKIRNFFGVECMTNRNFLWWSHNTKKWFTEFTEENTIKGYATDCIDIYNLKQLIRHAKKHSKYLPKGTTFILRSNFVGHNIYCIL